MRPNLPSQHSGDPSGEPSGDDWRITAYAFGQLEGDELAEFEQRLQTDSQLRRAVQETSALVAEMTRDALQEDAQAPTLSPASREKLTAAFGAPSGVPPVKTTAGAPVRSAWVAGLLAVAAVGLVAVVWGYRQHHFQTLADAVVPAASISAVEEMSRDSEEIEPAPQGIRAGTDEIYLPPSGPVRESEAGDVLAQVETRFGTAEAGKKWGQSQQSAAQKDEWDGEVQSESAANPANVKESLEGARPVETFALEDSEGRNGRYEAAVQGQGAPLANPTTVPAAAGLSKGSGVPRPDNMDLALGTSGEGQSGEGQYPGMGAAGGMAGGYPGAGNKGGRDNGMMSGGMGGGMMRGKRESGGAAGPYGGMPGMGPVRSSRERLVEEGEPSRYYLVPQGRVPHGDAYAPITENPFEAVAQNPLSTFSIDVDTASYSKIRMFLQQYHRWPEPDAVRIEEMINYFPYAYPQPEAEEDVPFSAAMEMAACPWNSDHRLARVAIQGRAMENQQRAASNLVFLLDVSGSMDEPLKLPLVRRGLEMLVRQLGENDRVAIVVYAGAAGMVLDSTTADHKETILAALDRLQAGGSTNGGQGIQLAYQTARDHFIPGGTNRVILCTDGDFNVGTTGTDDLVSMVEREAKGGVFLSVLGFGMGNLNDAMLEAISGRGDGNYAFIDSDAEARKVLVEQVTGTLVTIAKDVKIQVEFNPARVSSYRLIGYENRRLAARDFNDDTKDAGEIGAGHRVTALYEIIPVGAQREGIDPLRYQSSGAATQSPGGESQVAINPEFANELLTLKLRYKAPEGGESRLLEFPITDSPAPFAQASTDFRFAAAVAGFGMLLRHSSHAGDATLPSIREIARGAVGDDPGGLRSEFIGMIDMAMQVTGR